MTLPLAGCGRRGPLEAPSAAAEKEQNQNNGSGTAAANPKPGEAAADKSSQIPSPFVKRSSFPLDPLL